MLAKILVFTLLVTAVVASPIGPHEEEEDLPVYTEKVVPNKPTQVPKFGSKKATTTPRKVHEKTDNRGQHESPVHTTSLPKAVLKSTKPIRGNTRPVRRTNHISPTPSVGYNEIKPTSAEDYTLSPPLSFIAAKGLGVEYASEEETPPPHEDPVNHYQSQRNEQPTNVPSRTARHHTSTPPKPVVHSSNFAPERIHHQSHSDLGPAVGNAPLLRYAVAPQRFAPVPAPARVKNIPDYGYSGNSYNEDPQPYIFGYELQDEYGSTQSRQEQGDDYGNKRGSYGYTDGHGIYRKVDYIADEHGFRAVVHTNEPGTEKQNPADVEMNSEANKY